LDAVPLIYFSMQENQTGGRASGTQHPTFGKERKFNPLSWRQVVEALARQAAVSTNF
jgi:hypothetical protein